MRIQPLPTLLFAYALSAINPVHAQESDQVRTLFGGGDKASHGGWGAPTATYTRMLEQDALFVGARGGWLVDHHLTIGIAGHGLVTAVSNSGYDAFLEGSGTTLTRKSQLEMGYGGLLIEPHIAPRSPVHISLPIIIGAGGCGYQYSSVRPLEVDIHNYRDQAQAFFVIEPGIDLELNLIPLVRLAVGASYRYTSELDLPGTPKDALHGITTGVSIKVGKF